MRAKRASQRARAVGLDVASAGLVPYSAVADDESRRAVHTCRDRIAVQGAMDKQRTGFVAFVLGAVWWQPGLAECAIAAELKGLDPVEVGFCESDAVFIGKVAARLETIRAYTAEGSNRTEHYRTETSTVRVLDTFKGKLPEKVSMIADLYDKQSGAFSFENGKEYLVFAKRLSNDNEYAGASERCSVQPTLPLQAAAEAIEQLKRHLSGARTIDCNRIRERRQAEDDREGTLESVERRTRNVA